MTAPRHLLLALLIVFAQLAAAAHAARHDAGKDGTLPTHACELCLAAHNLGSALPGMAVLPPVAEGILIPEAVAFTARSHLPAPPACQRAPPVA